MKRKLEEENAALQAENQYLRAEVSRLRSARGIVAVQEEKVRGLRRCLEEAMRGLADLEGSTYDNARGANSKMTPEAVRDPLKCGRDVGADQK